MSKGIDKQIGYRIRQAREEAGYTQNELGEWLSLSQGGVNKIETGVNSLTLKNLFKLSDVLNKSVAYFLDIRVGDLSEDEVRLLEMYREVPPAARRYTIAAMRSWVREVVSHFGDRGGPPQSD